MFRLVLFCLLAIGCLSGKLPEISNRIIGGFEAHINQYPYQVAVNRQDNSGPVCGGSLIAKKWVLTAAHCVFYHLPYYSIQTRKYVERSLGVRVGSDAFKSGGEFYKVKKGYKHPDWAGWNPYNTDYDFGLLELEEEVTLSDKVQIIKLADEGEELPVGAFINVTGWGAVDDSGEISQVLKGVQVQTMDQDTCIKRSSSVKKEKVTPRMFCSNQGPENACKGDSGGPAVHEGKQYGIVSWTKSCTSYPIVYAKVSAQRVWIRDISGV